jgi:ABC-type phosphate/phosphonate transport system ATPase subunit
VLKHCSTEVAKGEVVVVCGPSGSGKSTLIKCVNGGGTLPALFGLSRTQLISSGGSVDGTDEAAN